MGLNDPLGSWIRATTALVEGSMRSNSLLAEVTSQTLPAPVVMPPSESAGLAAIVAWIAPVRASARARLCDPQLGIQRLPKPITSPEQGFSIVMIVSALFVFASRRTT